MTILPCVHVLRCCYRPMLDQRPPIGLPIYPRSLGHFVRGLHCGEEIPSGQKPFVQFFWCLRGAGEVIVEPGGPPHVMQPGEAFYRLPQEPHILRSISPSWEYCWLAFDGPSAADFMRSYQYPRTPFPAGPCPLNAFRELENQMRELTPYCWRKMVSLICDILALAGGSMQEESRGNIRLHKALHYLKSHFQNPNTNVNTLADYLRLDRTTLRRLFLQKMQMPPSSYLSHLRLQKAMELLMQTDSSLKEIAEQVGYNDANYFCRLVKRKTGHTPGELRNQG